MNAHIFGCAASGGHTDVLRWLHEQGCPSCMPCAAAAASGHLHVLQWLRDNGYDWDEHTCIRAVEKGHFHILRWALDNGCPAPAGIGE